MTFTTRSDALARIGQDSEEEHQRLMQLKAAGELFYEPNPTDVYVWEVVVADSCSQSGLGARSPKMPGTQTPTSYDMGSPWTTCVRSGKPS